MGLDATLTSLQEAEGLAIKLSLDCRHSSFPWGPTGSSTRLGASIFSDRLRSIFQPDEQSN